MSMSDPLLPSSNPDDESTVAAEPGSAGPAPQYPEEPDVLPDAAAEQNAAAVPPAEQQDSAAAGDASLFRRPTPGDRLHPDELAAELGAED